MTESVDDTLACALRLLFDGRSDDEIAKAIAEVKVGDRWGFIAAVNQALNIVSMYTLSAEDEAYEMLEDSDIVYTGTLEQLRYDLSCIELYDNIYDDIREQRRQLWDELLKQGRAHYFRHKFDCPVETVNAGTSRCTCKDEAPVTPEVTP